MNLKMCLANDKLVNRENTPVQTVQLSMVIDGHDFKFFFFIFLHKVSNECQ